MCVGDRNHMARPLNNHTPTNYRERWGQNLRRLRQKRFDTMEKFAVALHEAGLEGMTKQSVSHYELGYRVPDLNHWPTFAAVLGISIRSLLPPNDNSPGQ